MKKDASLNDFEKKRVDVLLAEYRACYKNRDHYESVKWTIGAIFIAASLTLFGISFIKEVKGNLLEVGSLAFFSIALSVIWYCYNRYVGLYISESFERMWKIEEELQEIGFKAPKLHTSIEDKRPSEGAKGRWGRRSIILTVSVAWTIRILLLLVQLAKFDC